MSETLALLNLATEPRSRSDASRSKLGPAACWLIVEPAVEVGEARTRLAALFPGEPLDLAEADPGRWVLGFPERTFPLVPSDSAAERLGSAIVTALGARLAAPDLPRPVAPVKPDTAPGLESVDDFPPGCWVPIEPDLNDRPLWALDAIRIRKAWALSDRMGRPSRGEGVVIAQPDTGVTDHPELAGVRRAGAFNTLGDSPADDATDPLDTGFALSPGHGTAVGSVAVSRSRDARDRMVGSAPLASHMPIRALRSVWAHEELPVARAVDLAVAKGAHVITMSLGGVALPFSPLQAAIRRAVERHVIVMAAAGNCVGIVVHPARFPECIAVAGTDQHDAPWRGSCNGPAVAISAPAQNVLRASVEPRPAGSIGQGQGTSFAVALLSGVAACWIAHHGRARLIAEAEARGETLQAMFRRIARASARRPSVWDATSMGAGIVDAAALLEAPFDLGVETESPALAAEPRSPEEEIRALLTELAGGDPGLDDDTLLRHGNELAAALLRRRLDPGETPRITAELSAAMTGPLAAKLAPPYGAPAVHQTDADAMAAQAETVGRLRRSLAFGRARRSGSAAEAAILTNATDLPAPDEFAALLDRLLDQKVERTADEQADFERAVRLIRDNGLPGLQKLIAFDAPLGTQELAAAEALVKADGSRPSFLLRDGAVDPQDPFLGSWSEVVGTLRDTIQTCALYCGRIQPTGGHPGSYFGTGSLVSRHGPWVITNYHVLQQALRSAAVFFFKTDRGLRITGGLEIDFEAETGTDKANRWSIDEAVFPAKAGESFGYVDAVLLRLGRSLNARNLPSDDRAVATERIVFSPDRSLRNGETPLLGVVGFPNRPPQISGTKDGVDWGWVVGQLFGGRFGVKRFAPGAFYRAIGSHPLDAATKLAFGHDATTMKGSSGSIVISLTQAPYPAFGLHFAGFDNDSNFALTTETLARGFEGCGVPFP